MSPKLQRLLRRDKLPNNGKTEPSICLGFPTLAELVHCLQLPLLGIVSFVASECYWCLAAMLCSAARAVWQLRHGLNPEHPERQSYVTVWRLTAAEAGIWSMTAWMLSHQPQFSMIASLLAFALFSMAARHVALRGLVDGQALLLMTPIVVASVAAENHPLWLNACLIVLQMTIALSLLVCLRQSIRKRLLRESQYCQTIIRLQTVNQDLEVMNLHLEALAATDSLTSVANRRSFDRTCEREWRRSVREQLPLSLLLLDVDYFKAFNDLYGHQAGDACLRQVAAIVTSAAKRPGDLVARYGGEEFAVILPNTHLDGAIHLAETIRSAVDERQLLHEGSTTRNITVSIGAACLIPNHEENMSCLTAAADRALYAAKRAGRNKVLSIDLAQSEPTTKAGSAWGRPPGMIAEQHIP